MSPEDLTEKSLHARLRRLCEKKKGTGKLKVAEAIHEHWKNANAEEREKLAKTLAATNFQQAFFL